MVEGTPRRDPAVGRGTLFFEPLEQDSEVPHLVQNRLFVLLPHLTVLVHQDLCGGIANICGGARA